MNLVHVGSTAVSPTTDFYWDIDDQATVETTELGEDLYLIRASKSYRLVKQDAHGQESWDRNLVDMNQYLAEKFSSFNLSINYTDTTTPEEPPAEEPPAEEAAVELI